MENQQELQNISSNISHPTSTEDQLPQEPPKKKIKWFVVLIILLLFFSTALTLYLLKNKAITRQLLPAIVTQLSKKFPEIEVNTEGKKIQKLDSDLLITIKEDFEENKAGPKLTLILTTKRKYPSGCYGLAGGSEIINDEIYIIFSGISIYQGMCTQAIQAPSFKIPLDNFPKSYTMFIKYQESIDKYDLIVSEDQIGLTSQVEQKFTKLANNEFLRIPPNSMWMNIGYTDRNKFITQKNELIEGLKNLGVKEFTPKKGNYAYGGFWGLTTLDIDTTPQQLEYLSGHYADDFLYFTFSGDISGVRNLVSKFSEYECESGKDDCMSIAVWTWQGEKVFSWLLKNKNLPL